MFGKISNKGQISNKTMLSMCLNPQTSNDADLISPCSTRCSSPNESVCSRSTSRRPSIDSLDSITGNFDARSFVRHHKGSDMLTRKYDLDHEKCGEGGFATVFKATDKHCAGRVLAIKQCVCNGPEAVQKTMDEAMIMQQMDHPSICRLFELHQQGTTVWLVMEYCEGGDVLARIMDSKTGSLPEQTTADIVKQIAGALKYAHSLGVAHRDLKPENVCFASADKANTAVKVIDWGLSAQFSVNEMKTKIGTSGYTAPEVLSANGQNCYTSDCDLWSLGVCTYVSLVGKPPFWGETSEQLRDMRREKYPMSGKEWYSISTDCKDFIRGLLKPNPEERMLIDDVLSHPFLQSRNPLGFESSEVRKVLDNMLLAGSASRFFSICMASATRQLDHSSLDSIRKVFLEFDKNSDGVLHLAELQDAFKRCYGADSDVLAQVEQIFSKLDFDGSESISYTEFCAAGMGEDLCMREEALWSAFKSFDACDDDGIISAGEMQHVLSTGDWQSSLPEVLYEKVTREVVETYDVNHTGGIDFSEFKRMMRSCRGGSRQTYELLVHADSLANISNSSSEQSGSPRTDSTKAETQDGTGPPARHKKKGRSWARRFLNMMEYATSRPSRTGSKGSNSSTVTTI